MVKQLMDALKRVRQCDDAIALLSAIDPERVLFESDVFRTLSSQRETAEFRAAAALKEILQCES